MAAVMEAAIEVMGRPWKWGENDCCTAACDVFHQLYGVDPMAEFRGTYETEREALRLIRSQGGFVFFIRQTARKAGLVPSIAKPGALGIHDNRNGTHSLLVCSSPGVWLGKTRTGMTTARQVQEQFHVPV